MEKFNFGFINRDKVFIGDISIITAIDKNSLRMLKTCSSFRDDYTSACKVVIAKEKAMLIRVDKTHFIDIDYIKTSDDCEKINELLNSKSFENNIFLTHGTKEPYVGQLVLSNIKSYNHLKSSVTDVAKLKLINTQK